MHLPSPFGPVIDPRIDLGIEPANRARAQRNGLWEYACLDVEVNRASGEAGSDFDGRKPENRIRHMGTPLDFFPKIRIERPE
jgi:hypothetical protein